MCKDLDLDGLTPDINVIKNTLKSINIPIKVMIRPRAGNFIYQFDEVKKMVSKYLNEKNLKTVFLKPRYGDASGVRGAALLGRQNLI